MRLFLLITISFFGVVLCQRDPRNDCTLSSCSSQGVSGTCNVKKSAKRCECEKGWMGKYCHRPCQDVFKSCERWKREGRCEWERIFSTPFFNTNCAQSCGTCDYDEGNYLPTPIHPLLESVAWLVGAWETTTNTNDHFPTPFATQGGYKQRLEIKVNNVPMFDRPPLNVSSLAVSNANAQDVRMELGFIVGKIAQEDTGFDQSANDTEDQIAVETNSNIGINTVEEGVTVEQLITLKTVFKYALPGQERHLLEEAERRFRLLSDTELEESVTMTLSNGQEKHFKKVFVKVEDYLKAPLARV